jgi:hypothetical protein
VAPPTKGSLLEARVARLVHAEGAFVRRGVDLTASFRERFQVTDLDVLAFSFDRTLQARITNGECKTTEARSAPSSGDRLLWLVGVGRLVGADASFLATTKNASDNTRALAARLGLEIVEPRDLERREELVGLKATSPYGVHSPDVYAIAEAVAKTIKGDEGLRRVQAFVRSDLWLLPPVAALKRAIGACRMLNYSDALPEPERLAVAWLASQAIIGISLALTRIAASAYRQPEDVFERYLHERLAEGAASFAAMRDMSKTVDKYILGVLSELEVDPARATQAIGAFEPKPPTYADPLVELVQRLALAAPAAVDVARLAEYQLLAALDTTVLDAPPPAVDPATTGRLLRLIATFLERQAELPASLVEPLRSVREPGETSPRSTTGDETPSPPNRLSAKAPPADGSARSDEEAERPQLFESGS